MVQAREKGHQVQQLNMKSKINKTSPSQKKRLMNNFERVFHRMGLASGEC